MKTLPIFAAAFLFIISAFADTTLTESIDTGEATQQITMKFKGDKIRMEISPEMSTILDTVTGDSIMLMHSQKMYMKISGEKTKAMMAQMQAMKGHADATPAVAPKFIDTGRKEKVNNYDAEVYTCEMANHHSTYWIAKDFPNAAGLLAQMNKLQKSMQNTMGAAATGLAVGMTNLPGLPIKTETEINGKKMTVTLSAAKDQTLADSDFSIPDGYNGMQMPDLPGMGGH